MPRLRTVIEAALLVGITASAPAMAQTGPHPLPQLQRPIAPPIGLPGPGSQPDAMQQLEVQNYANQLDERQRADQFMTGPLAAERQMRTEQRLEQFSLTQ